MKIKRFWWFEKFGLSICDGSTIEMNFVDAILWPMFWISGISFFMLIMVKWTWLRNKILGNKNDY